MRIVAVTAIGSLSVDIAIKKCRGNGMRIIGCDVYPDEWIVDAGNADAFYQVPYASDADHHIETMLSIYREEGAKAVIPLTDAEINVFNLHRREFGEANVTLYMSDKVCISLYRDRMELYRYLEEHIGGVMIPTVRLEDADLDKISYPVVCKLCNGRGSQGPRFVGFHREVEGFLGEADLAGYIVQPMIRRNVVTVDVVRSPEQGTCVVICHGELLRTLDGTGTLVLVFRNRQPEERCRAIVGLLGIRGCVNVEFVEDQDSVYHMLECNSRSSGGVELSCLAGYDRVINYPRCSESREIERDGRIKSMYVARKYEKYITKIK